MMSTNFLLRRQDRYWAEHVVRVLYNVANSPHESHQAAYNVNEPTERAFVWFAWEKESDIDDVLRNDLLIFVSFFCTSAS